MSTQFRLARTASPLRPTDAQARQVRRGVLLRSLLFIIVTLVLVACQTGNGLFRLGPPSSGMLFIGNSFTFLNGGVDRQLQGLDPDIGVKQLAVGSYTLTDHWDAGEVLASIRREKWDLVVLQEQSHTHVIALATFLQSALQLSAEIPSTGAQTILFMT